MHYIQNLVGVWDNRLLLMVKFVTTPREKKEYALSNKIVSVDKGKGRFPKSAYMALIEKSSDTPASRQKYVQAMLDKLSDMYGVPKPKVIVVNKHLRTSSGVAALGYYQPVGNEIHISNITYRLGKVTTNRQVAKIALHELMHLYDRSYLNLLYSKHTAGFYKRISDLEKKLSE